MIFLDLDGVCCDFLGSVLKLFGMTEYDYLKHAKSSNKHPYDILNDCIGCDSYTMWNAVNKKENFWSDINKFPWFNVMFKTLQNFAPVYFLTSSPSADANYGKLKWIQNNVGYNFDRKLILCHSENKRFLSKRGRILIDDMDSNVNEWREEGGHSIKFPSIQFTGNHPNDDDLSAIYANVYDYIAETK